MSETDPHLLSPTLELLAFLTGGATGAARATDPGADRLTRSGDQVQDPDLRSDLRERLTDGIVELRKRGGTGIQRAALPPDGESGSDHPRT
ncbi:hypothetical protein OG389_31640 [Streptomyces sp. NBC_00435]|uniref:hypothetical protein n=1 Tax=Streptomyces sp. NBC_00435 TaxID=2903649 RepID=UPI002E2096FB